MKRVWILGLVIGLCMGLLPVLPVRSATGCSLCILEVKTQGLSGEEDQDFVIVANLGSTKISSSGIQLRYFNAQGVQANSLGIGTFEPGQVKIYANKSLDDVNDNLTGTFEFGLYSGGGSLQVARGSGPTTTVYDKIGWGQASMYDTSPAPLPIGGTLARRTAGGIPQDTDNNNLDFELVHPVCEAVGIQEIQPFVVDAAGQSTDAWIELQGLKEPTGDCVLVTKAGDVYVLPAGELPAVGETEVVDRAVGNDGQSVPLHIGEGSGQVWIAAQSVYGDTSGVHLNLPRTTVAYTNLVNGQSWAFVNQTWRRTFSPTPGSDNVYRAQAVLPDDPSACEGIFVTELLPNPDGEDTGKEWIEIMNQNDMPVGLASCQLSIAGEVYRFLSDDVLVPHEWRVVNEFYDADEDLQSWSLRNSGTVLIALQHVRGTGEIETLQAFEYADAPEGQSWARFEAGWRWEPAPTPGQDNTIPLPLVPSLEPTEFPWQQQPDGSGATAATSGVIITELLPNPASPATDGEDEFVELFNTSDQPIDMSGYRIQTGNNFNYSHTLSSQTIAPHSYMVITSGESSLSLANTAGKARLLNSAGQVVSETVAYLDAPEGSAWALIGGTWQWTALPTPGADNKLQTPVLTALAKSKSTTATVKSAAKSTAAKPAKTTNAAATKAAGHDDEITAVSAVHPMVLAVVGGLAVLYAAYEYRQDIANRIYQFRRNRTHRRTDRAPAEGRGTD